MFKSLDVGALPLDGMIAREWLATNGIGGYASSTIPCLNTRKYHGLLVAAMAPPVRRMVLLSRVEETVHSDGWPHALSTNEYPGTFHPEGYRALRAFSPEPFPRWAFQGENWTLQKELCLLQGQNTVVLTYTLLAAKRPVTLEVRPLLALRPIHDLAFQWNGKLAAEPHADSKNVHRIPATNRTPEVFFAHGGTFAPEANWYLNTLYRREQQRGYAALEDVWSPGVIRFTLQGGQAAHFVCSADPVDLQTAIDQSHAQGATTAKSVLVVDKSGKSARVTSPLEDAALDELTRAARQFVTKTCTPDSGSETCAVIGNFPWSPPSLRAALTGFAGLFLITGDFERGRSLLTSLPALLDRGLLPSDFSENGTAPLYLGADVSLWFANAVHAYLRYTGDEATVSKSLFDPLLQIIEQYRRGTRLGISTDSAGLLRTHAPNTPTTWMDAKVGDWVITPRHGRPVEINALWYNAVCIAADLAARFGRTSVANDLATLSQSIKRAFNERFWNHVENCCHDVVAERGPDGTIRPNQLLAISLPFPVLAMDRQPAALERVMRDLRTPVGVRTLAPHDSAYCGHYAGNVVSRDRAVHNGSAHPWLLGPLVSAYVRVNGRGESARREADSLLQGCIDHLRSDGLGQIPELFDGDPLHAPGGAIACALSVAEVLRAYYEDVLDRAPVDPAAARSTASGADDVIRSLPSHQR